MRSDVVVGVTLVAGLITFMIGAGAWRLAYEQPPQDALPVIHADGSRRRWIHVWMIVGVFVTAAGVHGIAALPRMADAGGLASIAAALYLLGAACMIASLAFRLTVVPWAAQRHVRDGGVPDVFAALDAWAGTLYVIHMAAAYTAFAVLGAAVLASGQLPGWLGWLGVAWGTSFLAGFAITRFSGPFNPPFLAHTYTALVGAVLLSQ